MVNNIAKQRYQCTYERNTKPFIENGIYVASYKKREEIIDILLNPEPSHYRRLWMVGFLKSIGCENEEILRLIDSYNQWVDYSPEKTKYQVESVKPFWYFSSASQIYHSQSEDREGIGEGEGNEEISLKTQHTQSSLWDLSEDKVAYVPGGDKTMSVRSIWRNVGEPVTHNLGYGKFLEVTKRTDGQNEGIVIANGQYGVNKDGNVDLEKKIYRNSLYLSNSNGAVDWLVGILPKILKEENHEN